jgi:putative tricarboxylic transport membrane protein
MVDRTEAAQAEAHSSASLGDDAGRESGLGWGDYLVPVFIFAFCAVVIYISTTFEEAVPIIVGHSMQPRVFPIFLMIVIGVLNLALIAQVLSRPASRRDWEPYQTWATGVLLGVFYLIASYVDMILALIVVMFALCMVWGERRWWIAALVALGTTAFIFFSFDLILEVRFPRGLLTNWYYG